MGEGREKKNSVDGDLLGEGAICMADIYYCRRAAGGKGDHGWDQGRGGQYKL